MSVSHKKFGDLTLWEHLQVGHLVQGHESAMNDIVRADRSETPVWLYKRGPRVLGWAAYGTYEEYPPACMLFVHTKYRRQGIARELIHACRKDIAHITTVAWSDTAAKVFDRWLEQGLVDTVLETRPNVLGEDPLVPYIFKRKQGGLVASIDSVTLPILPGVSGRPRCVFPRPGGFPDADYSPQAGGLGRV